jgi:hypothetical protein
MSEADSDKERDVPWPFDAERFGQLLARHGVIDHDAIDDPEGYDDYDMSCRIHAAWAELAAGGRVDT